MSNYRPVSLLPMSSKVLECIVYIDNRLVHHLSNSILLFQQLGLRHGSSTQKALLTATHDLYIQLDLELRSAAFFLDMSKAFDKIFHFICCWGLWTTLYSNGLRATSAIVHRKLCSAVFYSTWIAPSLIGLSLLEEYPFSKHLTPVHLYSSAKQKTWAFLYQKCSRLTSKLYVNCT